MSKATRIQSGCKLAMLDGEPVLSEHDESLFHWPIITREDEEAVLDVIRRGIASDININRKFEEEWGQYIGTRYNLAHCNGTGSVLAAMYGAGVGRGDEVIGPSVTFWGSMFQTMVLGAKAVFADIDRETLCIDPNDIEHRITKRTKAILVVHYRAHPADMDAIMRIARRHNLKVIEDVSHAQGAQYKGRMCGSLGDVAGISMMGSKSFALGEAGMLSTNDQQIYERAIAFCHYERIKSSVTDPALRELTLYQGESDPMPLTGIKGRMNQMCSAIGRVQLKYFPERITQIQSAVNRFWDLLSDVPGIRPHRPDASEGSNPGGWFRPTGLYDASRLGGLPVQTFIRAVNAEGGCTGRGVNFPMHLHPVLQRADVFNDGKPTRIAFHDDREVMVESLPNSETVADYTFAIPYFKHDRPEQIEQYAMAYRKVAENADQLLHQAV